MLNIRRVFQTRGIMHAKYSALLFQGHYRDFCSDSEKKNSNLDNLNIINLKEEVKEEVKEEILKSLKENNDFVSRRDYNESKSKFENTISEVEKIKNKNQKFGIDIKKIEENLSKKADNNKIPSIILDTYEKEVLLPMMTALKEKKEARVCEENKNNEKKQGKFKTWYKKNVDWNRVFGTMLGIFFSSAVLIILEKQHQRSQLKEALDSNTQTTNELTREFEDVKRKREAETTRLNAKIESLEKEVHKLKVSKNKYKSGYEQSYCFWRKAINHHNDDGIAFNEKISENSSEISQLKAL